MAASGTAATSPGPRPASACWPTGPPTTGRTTRRPTTTSSSSARAWRPTPICTSSASSAATDRPRSPSTPSSGRSPTTWTSSTCRSDRSSGVAMTPPPWLPRTRPLPAYPVVTSAGNSGPNPYVTGSPGTGTGAIATAAIDSYETFPGATLDLEPGGSIDVISANGIVPPDGTEYDVVVLTNDPDDRRGRAARLLGRGLHEVRHRGRWQPARGDRAWRVRPRRARRLRPAGRGRGGGDDQQRRQLSALRGPDPLESGHGRAVHGHDSVLRRLRSDDQCGRGSPAGRRHARRRRRRPSRIRATPASRASARAASGPATAP